MKIDAVDEDAEYSHEKYFSYYPEEGFELHDTALGGTMRSRNLGRGIISAATATLLINSARQSMTDLQLSNYISSLKIQGHKAKGPSKPGRWYRRTLTYFQRTGRHPTQAQEMARRRHQIAMGVIDLKRVFSA